MSINRERKDKQILGFLGVGFDNADGEQRITRSEHFLLLGGSQETHERMQDTAIKFNEGLVRLGKRLYEASLEDVLELFEESRQ